MITQNSPSEKTEIAFLNAFKSLKLAELLRRSGIRKTQESEVKVQKKVIESVGELEQYASWDDEED